ncbi:hypothetical protein Sjap_024405 [Stephania japonica]|uniref:Uncharacterized protein n=1 Tax=Stephania japonica TaxID=461633 RepID=A0AAP0HJU2_9MAGN
MITDVVVENYNLEKVTETKVKVGTMKYFCLLTEYTSHELVEDVLHDSHGGVLVGDFSLMVEVHDIASQFFVPLSDVEFVKITYEDKFVMERKHLIDATQIFGSIDNNHYRIVKVWLELKENKYILGEFLQFKGKDDDISELRNVKRSKYREIDELNEQLEEDTKALKHMQLQLLQERSRRSEVERENTMLQN